MSIPKDPTADCTLHITMGGPTLSDFLHTMTGVEFRVAEGKRQILLPNGATIIPMPVLRINGFNEAGISEMFTGDIDIIPALRESNLYKREMAGGHVVQSCVSFLVQADQDSDVVMELTLGRDSGDEMALRLYSRK